MIELVESGAVGAVIAPKLDRLFRDAVNAPSITRGWDARGVSLHLDLDQLLQNDEEVESAREALRRLLSAVEPSA